MGSRRGGGAPPVMRRESDLKKSFNLAVRSLLSTFSKQEFSNAFPNFASNEQERLHQLFIQVITSLHGNIENEFESLCLETEIGTAVDTVEQLVEEQFLDPLFSDKTNVMDAVHNLSTAKKAEIQYLRGLLKRSYYFQFVYGLKNIIASSKLGWSYLTIKHEKSRALQMLRS